MLVGSLAVAFLVIARAILGPSLPSWVALACLVVLSAVLFLGALVPSLEMYGPVLWRGPEHGSRVALTFDDGPVPGSTTSVLDCLASRGVRATFFVIGRRALEHPELVQRMVREGHAVGVHGMDHHRGYAFLSPTAVARDLEQAIDAVMVAGAPRPLWFRPPIGQASPRTYRGVRRVGLSIVGWSFRGRDGWRSTRAEVLLARFERALGPGAIVLLHDAWERPGALGEPPPLGVRLLPELLDRCAARGLLPVTLDELLRAESRGQPESRA